MTKYFVVTVLSLASAEAKRAMEKAVERTVRLKIRRGKALEPGIELKASKATESVKKYFYQQIADLEFGVYTIILEKSKLTAPSIKKPEIYKAMALQLFSHIPLDQAQTRLFITLDRSKGLLELHDFNRELLSRLQTVIAPRIPIEIFHADSVATRGLQAVDMLSSAIFHKYEYQDSKWYDRIAGKIRVEERYEIAPK